MKRIALLLLLLSAIVVIAFKERVFEPAMLRGRAMGSDWTLACEGKSPGDVRRAVAEELEHWEQVLSQWREDSDLSRYNRGEAATSDLARVLELAEILHEQTGGAFDFRVLEQVHQSGFGPAGKGADLSALGKGFAVDRVGERLRELGVDHFIFELGGEVLAGEGEWSCRVEGPTSEGQGEFLQLSNRAVATSGNYRQFRTSEEGLISHIIDPRSGDPVLRPPCSVTVFSEDCTTADAWATALFVLGPEARPSGAPEFVWNFGKSK